MKFISVILLFISNQTYSQIKTIEFVKILNDNNKEAIYYYNNNWKILRDIAIKKKYIKSYNLLINKRKEESEHDIVLITEYKDSLQLNLSEERFQKIIKEKRPNGPVLLNDIKPKEFKQNLFSSDFIEIQEQKSNKK